MFGIEKQFLYEERISIYILLLVYGCHLQQKSVKFRWDKREDIICGLGQMWSDWDVIVVLYSDYLVSHYYNPVNKIVCQTYCKKTWLFIILSQACLSFLNSNFHRLCYKLLCFPILPNTITELMNFAVINLKPYTYILSFWEISWIIIHCLSITIKYTLPS